MNNIKKIYQHAGKCDNKQNLKDILEDALLFNPEVFTGNIPNVHMESSPVKKVCNSLLINSSKRKGHSKINEQIKRNVYTWITRHPQVVQSPISNDYLKFMLDDQTEPQLVPKSLLQVSIRELRNILVNDPNDGGIKDAWGEDGKIIISDSTLRSLLPSQLKQMSARYKVMCGCECCISAKSIHSSLLYWCDRYLKKLKDKIQNSQSRRSGDKVHHIYETYKIQ